MELTCPSCKATNQYANERCTECGAMLRPGARRTACPACRVRVKQSTAYCPNCGQPLGGKAATAKPLAQIAGLRDLRGGRQCSKCGMLRSAGEANCPECGTRRSRIADPVVPSFWDLVEHDRKKIAIGMKDSLQEGLNQQQAAARLFDSGEHPYFREFPQFYDLLGELFA